MTWSVKLEARTTRTSNKQFSTCSRLCSPTTLYLVSNADTMVDLLAPDNSLTVIVTLQPPPIQSPLWVSMPKNLVQGVRCIRREAIRLWAGTATHPSCGNPHVPFFAHVGEDNSRPHPDPQGYTFRFLPIFLQDNQPCCMLSTRHQRRLSIGTPYFSLQHKLRQASVRYRPAYLHRSQAGLSAVNHVSESPQQRRNGCPPSRGGLLDAIWRTLRCSSVTLRQGPRLQGEKDGERLRLTASVACEPLHQRVSTVLGQKVHVSLLSWLSTPIDHRSEADIDISRYTATCQLSLDFP